MTLSNKPLAALRTFLASEPQDVFDREPVDANDVEGFGELVYAAFVTAIRRRFPPTWTIPQVIRLVAAIRARLIDSGTDIDPHTAEVLIRRALGDRPPERLDEEARAMAQVLLLAGLVADEGFDDAGLDGFLAQAQMLADQSVG
jgi:hypothetical protein